MPNYEIPVMTPLDMEPDAGAVEQIVRCAETPGIDRVALMGDHHKGYGVPIGGVIASATHISPSGVGFDIACGNKAVLTDATWGDIKDDLSTIMDDVFAQVSFGVGRKNAERVEHPLFDRDEWNFHPVENARELAIGQLGTVGSGNHYVDLLTDEIGRIWIGVHFGSRGLGHKTATFFLKQAGAKDDMDSAPCLIPVSTGFGQDYLTFMNLAGDYAYAGRDWVCNKVLSILGASAIDEVHNHHNFAWLEETAFGPMWVVRKGATPCFPGQRGFIGGSMGDICVIVEGVEHDNVGLLNSTVHGAGRVMSRTQAAGKFKRIKSWSCTNRDCTETRPWTPLGPKDPKPTCVCGTPMRRWDREEQVRPGVIDWEGVQQGLRAEGLELRGAGADEAPGCYKSLSNVLDAHKGTLNIVHTLVPIGVAMAPRDVIDPYKD